MSTTFPAIDPSTRQPFAEIPESSPEEVDAAVRAARGPLRDPDWRTPANRVRHLRALARGIEAQLDELAELESRDTGKPLAQARADARVTVDYFDFYAGAADKLRGSSIPLGPGFVDYTVREPWGVCAQIIPWNYPMQVLARCTAPALAAGNTVVLKPSELGSVTPRRIASIARACGLPDGALAIVTGHGQVGQALVGHDGVDFVTFVGSAAVGRLVAADCAARLTPVQLELGGKSPNVVFADADLERAAPAVVRGLLQNAGQSCSAGSRLLVERAVADELVERIAALMDAVSIGPGLQDFDLGPLVSEQQLARARGMLERAIADGVLVRRGGGVPAGLDDGWYLEPTILEDVHPGQEIFEEEVFGPVLSVTGFSGESEAIELANATPYGLVAGVWCSDVGRAHRVAAEIAAGQIYINGYGVAGGIELPFGGMKRSGYGRGKGLEAMESYTQIKNVCVAL
ncbi:MAG TPA: aldehyde dehydrogenase family protein [Solirubrobacteraceae bacterium]|nr:aldehyde dehydrogenase family protein [Solirubrobacteraceae bacterium]